MPSSLELSKKKFINKCEKRKERKECQTEEKGRKEYLTLQYLQNKRSINDMFAATKEIRTHLIRL